LLDPNLSHPCYRRCGGDLLFFAELEAGVFIIVKGAVSPQGAGVDIDAKLGGDGNDVCFLL